MSGAMWLVLSLLGQARPRARTASRRAEMRMREATRTRNRTRRVHDGWSSARLRGQPPKGGRGSAAGGARACSCCSASWWCWRSIFCSRPAFSYVLPCNLACWRACAHIRACVCVCVVGEAKPDRRRAGVLVGGGDGTSAGVALLAFALALLSDGAGGTCGCTHASWWVG